MFHSNIPSQLRVRASCDRSHSVLQSLRKKYVFSVYKRHSFVRYTGGWMHMEGTFQKSNGCLPDHIAVLKWITQWCPDMKDFFLRKECSHKWLLCYSLQLCRSQTSHRWADLWLSFRRKKEKKGSEKCKLLLNLWLAAQTALIKGHSPPDSLQRIQPITALLSSESTTCCELTFKMWRTSMCILEQPGKGGKKGFFSH